MHRLLILSKSLADVAAHLVMTQKTWKILRCTLSFTSIYFFTQFLLIVLPSYWGWGKLSFYTVVVTTYIYVIWELMRALSVHSRWIFVLKFCWWKPDFSFVLNLYWCMMGPSSVADHLMFWWNCFQGWLVTNADNIRVWCSSCNRLFSWKFQSYLTWK